MYTQCLEITAPVLPENLPMNGRFHYDFNCLDEYMDILRSKLRLAVIYGGNKTNQGAVIYQTVNARPWKSYESVARDIQHALLENGFQHVQLMPDDMTLLQRLQDEQIHMVWLNTGGVQGYNPVSHTPSLLEMAGIPYVGHNSLQASILDNKHAFKLGLQAIGIKTAPFITWHPYWGPLEPGKNGRFRARFGDYQGPFIVKPISGRASLYVLLADTIHDLPAVANEVYQATLNTVLIETYLPGREFCVSVCGEVLYRNGAFVKHERPFAFSAIERNFEQGEAIFTSMDQKQITLERVHLLGDSEPEIKQQLLCLGETVYREFNLETLIRLDARADASGVLHVLEANPKPDLKRPEDSVISLVTVGLAEHGADYNDLILSLLANRLDYLFTYNIGMVQHIVALLA